MSAIPRYKIGDVVLNNSTFWHSAGGESDYYAPCELNEKGKIIKIYGTFKCMQLGYTEDATVYLIKWLGNGNKTSKSELSIKDSDEYKIRKRRNNINKILSE